MKYLGTCSYDQMQVKSDDPFVKCVCGRIMSTREIANLAPGVMAGDVDPALETWNVVCPRDGCGRVFEVMLDNGQPIPAQLTCSCITRSTRRVTVKVPVEKVIDGVHYNGFEEREKSMVSSGMTYYQTADLLELPSAIKTNRHRTASVEI